ncbi:hypothetical protein J2S63_000214 [Marmoricola bigeumensis]|uniref:Uncharacterized protein n=1 Tax=Nocardioides marmoribigeumensis TaxID=433649 RepID=A0ABU2BPV5_9ACTN|nr:hypothetical protein [Nocardioides marmoribigeumensis]
MVDTTYPSAASCSKADTTRPLDTPSWSASTRVDGSRSPGASTPDLMASRSASWTWCPRGVSAERSTAIARAATTPLSMDMA